MKYNLINIFLTLIFLISCTNNYTSENNINDKTQDFLKLVECNDFSKYSNFSELELSNIYFSEYYDYDGYQYSFSKNTNLQNLKKFSNAYTEFNVKEQECCFYLKVDYQFLPVDTYVNKDFFIVPLLFFQNDEFNENKVLSIMLSSYNKYCNLRDALLVQEKFTFEIEYDRHFLIKNDSITINKISTDYVILDEGGIVDRAEVPQIDTLIVIYKFNENTGKFDKIN